MGVPDQILKTLTDENSDSVSEFCNSIQEIFACTKSDIIELCEKLNLQQLKKIRESLFVKVCDQQPSLHGHVLRLRRKKKNITGDIYVIGNSLVNGLEDKKLQRLLKKEECSLNESEVSSDSDKDDNITINPRNLMEACVSWKSEVVALTGKVNSLESRLKDLEAEITMSKHLKKRTEKKSPSASLCDLFTDSEDDSDSVIVKMISPPRPNPKAYQTIVAAEVHADINGKPQMPQIGQRNTNINEVITKAETPLKNTSAPLHGDFRHTTTERRNIINGRKPRGNLKVGDGRRMSITGSASGFDLEAAPQTNPLRNQNQLVYIGRLSKNANSTSVREHLMKIGILNDDIADVIQLNCRNPDQKSFCISLHAGSEIIKNVVFSPRNWPYGVMIRPFSPSSRHKSRHTSTRSFKYRSIIPLPRDNLGQGKSNIRSRTKTRSSNTRDKYLYQTKGQSSKPRPSSQRFAGPYLEDNFDLNYRSNAQEQEYRSDRFDGDWNYHYPCSTDYPEYSRARHSYGTSDYSGYEQPWKWA